MNGAFDLLRLINFLFPVKPGNALHRLELDPDEGFTITIFYDMRFYSYCLNKEDLSKEPRELVSEIVKLYKTDKEELDLIQKELEEKDDE